MTMNRQLKTTLAVALAMVLAHSAAWAQCDTCAPVAAVQPVAVQQTVAYQPTGWYPGRLLDRMRLSRWFGAAATTPTTYATTTTAAYAPATTTASYSPYTASYTPYVTAYAPLASTTVARPAVQTSFYRPVVMRPVVAETTVAYGCAEPTCCAASPCDACSGGGVSQAIYSDGGSDCPGCASAGSTVIYEDDAGSSYGSQGHAGPATPQPTLEPTPDESYYRGGSQDDYDAGYKAGLEAARREARKLNSNGVDETGVGENGSGDNSPEEDASTDPSPVGDDSESSTDAGLYNYPDGYPKLFPSSNDRTARRPHVPIRPAVYRRATKTSAVSTSTKVQAAAKTQAERDAEGWGPVRRGR